jgi:hypothetical protein
MVVKVSNRTLLKIGLNLVSCNSNENILTKVDNFKSFYGSDPNVVRLMLNDLQTTTIQAARLEANEIDIDYFLMSLYFLRCYPSEIQLGATFKVSKKTVRKWIWFYVKKIQLMKGDKVRYKRLKMPKKATCELTLFYHVPNFLYRSFGQKM